MRKVLLDFSNIASKEELYDYIAEQMEFSPHFGKNLDALYDELTSISEPTAVGIFYPIADMIDLDIDFMVFLDSVSEVFTDAESDNASLGVIYGDLMANPEYEGLMDDADLFGAFQDGEDMDDDYIDEDLPEDGVVFFDLSNGQ